MKRTALLLALVLFAYQSASAHVGIGGRMEAVWAALLFAQAQPPACVSAQRTFSATGAMQSYDVPVGATALLLSVNGASGGNGVGSGTSTPGGFGFHEKVGLPASGLTSLTVVVGGAGGTPPSSFSSGGGGGGSFVFNAAGPLVIGGGGGGGAWFSGGGSAQSGAAGANGSGPVGGAGGTAGNGGAGAGNTDLESGGGGGGFFSAGGNGAGTFFGFGGHQISAPGDAAGGAGSSAAGGIGGGGGAASFGGGGGGGYSGGGGGGAGAGGGGGSFVAASGTIYESSLLATSGDGSVTICATAIITPPVPAPMLDRWAWVMLVLLTASILLIGKSRYTR